MMTNLMWSNISLLPIFFDSFIILVRKRELIFVFIVDHSRKGKKLEMNLEEGGGG